MIWFWPGRTTLPKNQILQFGLLAFVGFIFPSTFRHLLLGQIDILLMLLLLILSVPAIERCQWILAGFCLAVALTKPQLCILALPCILADLLFIKKHSLNAAKLIFTATIISAALTIPLWVANSPWLRLSLFPGEFSAPIFLQTLYKGLAKKFHPGYNRAVQSLTIYQEKHG